VKEEKDLWDKLDIIGKGLVLPLIIFIVGLFGEKRISGLENAFNTAHSDREFYNQFSQLYDSGNPSDRRLMRWAVHKGEFRQ